MSLTDGAFSTGNFVIDPTGTLAYAVEERLDAEGVDTLAKITKFSIDPSTGLATRAAQPAATYKANGPCTPAAEASFHIYGFNPAGTVMYDYWDCNYPFANNSAIYFSRSVNPTTGALGNDHQIFDWADGNFGIDVVNLTPGSLIYFSVPNNDSQGMNSVNVYSLQGSLEFSCTASMLEACGYGIGNTVDRTGKFDFIQISSDSTQITKLEPSAKKIVDTGNYIQGNFQAFAPDDALIYTYDPELQAIHGSFPSTSSIQPPEQSPTPAGGEIWANIQPQSLIPALRQ